MEHVRFGAYSIALALGFFFAMVVFIEVGRRWGLRRAAQVGGDAQSGLGRVEAAVYAVLSLLLGFTFSGAAARYDHRRELVVEQAIAINDVWQFSHMLPKEQGEDIRAGLRGYVDALLATYSTAPGTQDELRERGVMSHAERYVWGRAVAATRADTGEKARMLLMPALDAMLDAVEEDRLAQRIHPPLLVWAMLTIAAVFAGLFAGYGMSSAPRRSWFHVIGTAATISITMFVILELESPRLGLIKMDRMDRALLELRETMD
jgi:hypothetical protein